MDNSPLYKPGGCWSGGGVLTWICPSPCSGNVGLQSVRVEVASVTVALPRMGILRRCRKLQRQECTDSTCMHTYTFGAAESTTMRQLVPMHNWFSLPVAASHCQWASACSVLPARKDTHAGRDQRYRAQTCRVARQNNRRFIPRSSNIQHPNVQKDTRINCDASHLPCISHFHQSLRTLSVE